MQDKGQREREANSTAGDAMESVDNLIDFFLCGCELQQTEQEAAAAGHAGVRLFIAAHVLPSSLDWGQSH